MTWISVHHPCNDMTYLPYQLDWNIEMAVSLRMTLCSAFRPWTRFEIYDLLVELAWSVLLSFCEFNFSHAIFGMELFSLEPMV